MNRNSTVFLLLLCLILAYSDAIGQSMLLRRKQESKVPERGVVVIGTAGLAAVRSDICGTPDCNEFRPVFGVGAMYKFDPIWSTSINLDYVKLGATEKDPARPRNLSF